MSERAGSREPGFETPGRRTPAATAAAASEPPATAPSPTDPPRALIVTNPVSAHGDSERLRAVVADAITARGGELRVFETTGADGESALDQELARARADRFNLVIAAGGDGTVSLVVNRLIAAHGASSTTERRMQLAIVPLGTANVLARELQIPIDLEAAAVVAAERRRVVDLDAMELGGKRYVTQIGVGLDARMIGETSRESQQRHGRWAYFGAFLRMVRVHRASHFTIHVDGKRHLRVRAWQVVIANASTFGLQPFTWGPDIDPADGVLDVCVYDVHSPLDTIKVVFRVLTGMHRSDQNMRFLAVRDEVRIESRLPLPVQGDGELLGNTPITVRRVSGAVSVVVPEAVEDVVPEAPPVDESPPGRPFATAESAPDTPLSEARLRANPERRRALARVAQHVLLHRVSTFAAMDAALFLRVNSLRGGAVLDLVMGAASRAMDLGEGWIALVIVLAIVSPRFGPWTVVHVVGALWLTMWIVNHPLKRLFCRDRPFVAYVKARVVGRKPSDSSFPSGHTAAAFAGATLLTPLLPPLAPLFYAYALLVGVSRLYLGVHYPSDVTIGAVTGALLAAGFRSLLRWLLPGG